MIRKLLIIILIIVTAFLLLYFIHNKIKKGGMVRRDKNYSSESQPYKSWFQIQIDNFPKDKDFITPQENPQLLSYFTQKLPINDGANLNDFHFTRTSIFSTTPQEYSLEIINYMANCLFPTIDYKENKHYSH